MPTPRWARLLLSSIRLQRRLAYRYQVVVEETLRAFIPAARRDEVTADLYGDTAAYRSGGDIYRRGLFAWERELLASEDFPHTGRLLLGAAGAGRELVPLVDLGYEVVAFEPSDLVEEARAFAEMQPRATVVRASYADLVRAVRSREGPLAPVVAGRRFDGIILGWGSISHVLDAGDRLTLFRALRELAPEAPVVASYIGAPDASARFRRRLRDLATRVGGAPPSGVMLRADSGFTYVFTPQELELLALQAGYTATIHEAAPDRFALFVPTKRR
jgi:hypothetical protein